MAGEDEDRERLLREFEANEDVKTRFAACLRSDFLVCEFARGVSHLLDYNVVWEKRDYAPTFIDERIRIATDRGQMCIIIMPPVKTPIALARLISALQEGERWKVQVGGEAVGRSRVVNISWCDCDTPASVMGFFPGGVMPVTRRTPYAAMAIWAAGARNVHRKRPGDTLCVDEEALRLAGLVT